MKCKQKRCELESGHAGRCNIAQIDGVRNPPVTMTYTSCNQCVTKDAEIAGLRNQLAAALRRVEEWAKISVEIDKNHRKKAKRDRAQYMRDYRAKKPLGIAYG